MQSRRTRSASVPETRDERQRSLPPAHGIRATIPSEGFLDDPEALLRRRRRRREDAENEEGIDAMWSFLPGPLAAAQTKDAEGEHGSEEEQGSEQDGSETETESEPEDDEPIVRERLDDVDEGYQTGFMTTYETDAETEFDAESGLHAFTNIIDLDHRRPRNPVPAIITSLTSESPETSTPTSPDPPATPIQSPRPTTTAPPPFLCRRENIHTPSHTLPPLDIFDDDIADNLQRTRAPALGRQHPATNPQPSSSFAPVNAPMHPLARSQPVPPAPQPTPPRRSRNDIAKSTGTLSHSNTVSDESDDDEDTNEHDDSDDEGDVTAEQAAIFRRGPPSTDFRSPLSTEECSATYTAVPSELEEWFDNEYDEFSTVLLVGGHGYPGAMVETPFLFIAVPNDTPLPSASSLPPSVSDSSLAIVACHVNTDFGVGENADRSLPRRHLVTGLAVGCDEHTETTTLGAIIRRPDGSHFGMTSGHLFDNGPVGALLTQSNLAQCKEGLVPRQRKVDEYTLDITKAMSSYARDTLAIAQGALEQEVKLINEFVGETDADTLSNLKAGVLFKRELKTARIGGVRRIVDYTLFDIDELRSPRGDIWTFAEPTGGVLGREKGTWAMLSGLGGLAWDLQVRKNGAVTGFTFGVVAGVTTSMKLLGNRRTREYYIMPEQNFASNPFAKHGDSGSAIISRAGNLAGFVMAKSILKDFTVLVHPRTGHLDLSAITEVRNKDGSIDYERAYFEEFKKINVTLGMCSSVLEKMTGVRGVGELILDC